jgi:CheY-like chemotaxis protein
VAYSCGVQGVDLQQRRKRLLVIDDAADNVEFLRIVLESDFDLATCSSCADTLNQIRHIVPDLLLMDIAMPDVNGVSCLQRIRSTPEFKNIPAIAITALAYARDRQQCLDAGFQEVVVKPVLDYVKLRQLIDSVLQQSS